MIQRIAGLGLPCLFLFLLSQITAFFSSSVGVNAQAAQEVLQSEEKASNNSLLWGPYRPNLYFGIRSRIPKSLSAGLLWARVDDYESVQTSGCTLLFA